jgi:hypothetical protein
MNADDLTPSQAEKIYKSLRPSFAYLASLQSRMEARGWDQNDRLYLEVKRARDAMQLLTKELHSIMCKTWMKR